MKLSEKLEEANQDCPIVGLVNNAAIQDLAEFENADAMALAESFAVNVNAPYIMAKLTHKMLAQNGGTIINIGSIHSQQTKTGFLAYSVSKAGLRGLTKGLALELGASVKVNSIEPAAISTNMLAQGLSHDEVKLKELKFLHPTRSVGAPSEVADLACYLIESAPQFLNGSCIELDGGISSLLSDV